MRAAEAAIASRTVEEEEEEEEDVARRAIGEQFLKLSSGRENLKEVRTLDLNVDCTDESLQALGELMPNLERLKLSGSTIPSCRDLGTRLTTLKVIWLSRCRLTSLDGIGALKSLKELYAAFNDIDDLTALAFHDAIEVIDLDGNLISDLRQVEQLGTCAALHTLSLESNPVAGVSSEYRQIVATLVPTLEVLDDVVLSPAERRAISKARVSALLDDGPNDDVARRSSSSTTTGGVDDRLSEVLRVAARARTRSKRPANRRAAAEDAASELTHGADARTFVGPLARAIRSGTASERSTGPSILETLDRALEIESRSRAEQLAAIDSWRREDDDRVAYDRFLRRTAVGRSDDELIELLRRPPRKVPELRTKRAFRAFFAGTERSRMRRLLRVAYGEAGRERAERRMAVLEGALRLDHMSDAGGS